MSGKKRQEMNLPGVEFGAKNCLGLAQIVDKCREAQEKTGKKDVGVVFEVDRYLCEGLTMGDEVSLWRGAPLATFIDYRPGSSALLMYAADELIAAIDNVARERAG